MRNRVRIPISILLLSIAGLALAQVVPGFRESTTVATNLATRAVPDGGEPALTWMRLDGVRSWRLSVCARVSDGGSAQTLAGTGTINIYSLDPNDGFVKYNPSLDQAVTATTRCQIFPDFVVGTVLDNWKIIPAVNGVGTVNANSVEVRIAACPVSTEVTGGCP